MRKMVGGDLMARSGYIHYYFRWLETFGEIHGAAVDAKAIERQVMADQNRPCLYGVAGPCQHPNCLEAHFQTLYAEAAERQ